MDGFLTSTQWTDCNRLNCNSINNDELKCKCKQFFSRFILYKSLNNSQTNLIIQTFNNTRKQNNHQSISKINHLNWISKPGLSCICHRRVTFSADSFRSPENKNFISNQNKFKISNFLNFESEWIFTSKFWIIHFYESANVS